MRKRAIIVVVLVLLSVAGFLGVRRLLERAMSDAMVALADGLSDHRFAISPPVFESWSAVSWREFVFRNVSARGMAGAVSDARGGLPFFVEIDQATLRLVRLSDRDCELRAEGLKLSAELPGDPSSSDTALLQGTHLEVPVRLSSFSPRRAADSFRSCGRGLMTLLTEGRTAIPLSFTGSVRLSVDGHVMTTPLHSEASGDDYRLVMDPAALGAFSDAIGEELGDDVLDLMAGHPLKLPALLAIRSRARRVSRQALARNPGMPEDAYRHVLAGYLLTKAFGQAFALQLTEAYETDDTAVDRLWDSQNSALGGEYALRGYREETLLSRMLTDPAAP